MTSSPSSAALQRAIDDRHRHRLPLAAAEGETEAVRQARLAVLADDELVDHVALGDAHPADGHDEADLLGEEFDLDLAGADLSDHRMVRAEAAHRRIGEADHESLVAAHQRLQAHVARRREAHRLRRSGRRPDGHRRPRSARPGPRRGETRWPWERPDGGRRSRRRFGRVRRPPSSRSSSPKSRSRRL